MLKLGKLMNANNKHECEEKSSINAKDKHD